VTANAAAGLTRFRLGISEAVNTVLAIWMAEDAGLYADAGLEVEITNMNGGSRGAAELAAGRIDAMHVGLSSVIGLNRNGGDLRAIAALANVIRFTFFCAPGLRGTAELRGGTIGISTFGSETDTTASYLLRRLGLTRDDVAIKEFGGGSRRLAALRSGEIQVTAVNEPVASAARAAGVPVLLDLVAERVPWLFTAIVTRRGAIERQRDALRRFIAATAAGNRLALTDEARAKAVLARNANISDPKVLDIAYDDFKQLSPPDLAPTDEAARNILALFPEASQNIVDYVDRSILDELKRGV
jgi:ABC-type nitrate/sulfonate/bicarbonate transport system substrate-binding protein